MLNFTEVIVTFYVPGPACSTVTLQIFNALRNGIAPMMAVPAITFIGVSIVTRLSHLPRLMGAAPIGWRSRPWRFKKWTEATTVPDSRKIPHRDINLPETRDIRFLSFENGALIEDGVLPGHRKMWRRTLDQSLWALTNGRRPLPVHDSN